VNQNIVKEGTGCATVELTLYGGGYIGDGASYAARDVLIAKRQYVMPFAVILDHFRTTNCLLCVSVHSTENGFDDTMSECFGWHS